MNFQLDYSTKIILRVVLILLALAFLWLIRDVVIIILLSLVIASAMDPMVDYLNKHKIPRSVSVLSAYVIVIALIALIASLMVPLVINQFQVLSQNFPHYIVELQARYPNIGTLLGSTDPNALAQKLFHGFATSDQIFDRTLGLFNGLFAVITVLVISFYLVAADRGMKQFIHDLVPPQYQDVVGGLVVKIQRKMGLWVVGQIILSLFIFGLTFIGLSLLGVQYALFLAILAGLLEIVPYLGPFLSAVPAVFFALIQNPPLALAVIVLYILIQKTEGYILVPKVMEKTVGTSPLVVLLSLLIGFKIAGVLGLLLAVPLAGAVTVVLHEFFHNKPVHPDV